MKESPANPIIAEIVSFRAVAEVTQPEMVRRAAATTGWLARQPGFISRVLSCDEDGAWTDHVLWQNLAAAQAAGAAFITEPSAAPLLQAIDGSTVRMQHAPVLLRQG